MKHVVATAIALLLCLPIVAQTAGCGPVVRSNDRQQYDQAVAAYQRKDYTGCATAMRKISAKNPKAPDPYFYLGMCAVRKDFNTVGIRRYFTKLISLCPDYPNPLAHYYMGVIYYSDDRFDEAVECLQRYFDMVSISADKEAQAAYAEASNYLHWATFLAEATRNQVPFFPTVVRGASSKHNESLPYLSPDGKTMYYLRQVPVEKNRTFYARDIEEKAYQLHYSRWRDTSFSAGEPLDEPFNQGESEGSPTLTADGRTLYYSVLTAGAHGYANCDIFYTVNRGGKWDERRNAGRNVNGENTWESQPSITPDGQYLYFASNRQGGQGGTDIWRCHRLPNGDWSRAENLGPTVNTAGDEKCPFIHADGHTLYFASNGWQGFGGYDLYFIDLADNYNQRPTNLGLPINSERDEICFGVATDGKMAYYSGRATDYGGVGGTDIFSFDLYPAAAPEPMALHTSAVTNTDGQPLPATVTLLRDGAPDAVYLADSADGYVALVLSCQTTNLVCASATGYLPLVMAISAAKARSANVLPKRLELKQLTNGASQTVDLVVQEGLGLTATSQMLLQAYAQFLLQNPSVHASIEMPRRAHAKEAYDYLLQLKLRPERLTYDGGSGIASPRIVFSIR
ncbi:MAG: PD40 domain-containing protein [Bacteroidales bacterium]|nr:PD40 domain-containing protein [Bacteroidales bacterium]